MEKEKAITKVSENLPALMTKEAEAFIKKYVAPKAQQKDFQEIQINLMARGYTLQDTLIGKCHILPYWDIKSNSYRYQIVSSIHDMLAKADETNELDGIEQDSDGGNEFLPTWAEAKVYRKDRTHPFSAKVLFNEYAKKDKNGNITGMWKKTEKPVTMLRKVALAHALRLGFAAVLQGVYAIEEMGTVEATVSEPEPQKTTKGKQAEKHAKFVVKCEQALKWLTDHDAKQEYPDCLGGFGYEKAVEIRDEKIQKEVLDMLHDVMEQVKKKGESE